MNTQEQRHAEASTARYDAIMKGAMICAERDGLFAMSRATVAAAGGVSPTSVNHAFGTVDAMRHEAIKFACDYGHHAVVRQAFAHPMYSGLVSCEAATAAIANIPPC
jgi:DNA-binding transcriptional regulator YbjK